MSDSAPPPPPPPEPTNSGPTGSTGPGGPPPGQPPTQPPTQPPMQPPAQQPGSQPTPGPSNMSGDQMKAAFAEAHKYDLAMIGIGVVAFIVSMFPFYKGTLSTSGSIEGLGDAALGGDNSGTWSAWHGFFGWFAAVLALVAAGMLIAHLLRVSVPFSHRLAVLGLFGVSLLCTLLAFIVNPLPGSEGKESFGGVTVEYSKGVGWGYWLFLILIIAGTVLAFMRKDAND